MNPSKRITLAIQSKGRLFDDSVSLLKASGLDFRFADGQLRSPVRNYPIDLIRVRNDDIPTLLEKQVVDIGIVGENTLIEKQVCNEGVEVLSKLNFGACELCIAVPEASAYSGPADLDGVRIATSYPNTLADFMRRNSIDYSAVQLSGSIEVAPGAGLADAVCDLVSTGGTLRANGLRAVETIATSEAVLACRRGGLELEQQKSVDRLIDRFNGVKQAQETKYIMLHAPTGAVEDIAAIIPSAETPTVLELSGGSSQVAVHAVCNEPVFWDTMETLRSKGATSILVLPIEKMLE